MPRAVAAVALQRLPRPDGRRVVYNSFDGRYSDNPRAIYEELVQRAGPRAHVWIADGASFPPDAATVKLYGRSYLSQVGHAKHVVSNVPMPANFQKRRSVTYLQTWHGTPLKRIGFDNPVWRPARLRRTARDFAKWDYLISPNSFSTEIFRRAFRFDGEILETGYPRNDALNAPDKGEIRKRVRSELGLAEDVKVVLYAPTWRDNLVDEKGALGFTLALDLDEIARLSDDHVVLLRLHHRVAVGLRQSLGPFVRNVSHHADIRELYLAADALITDYSSAMFDFAVTGKPIVFFAYDLADYRDAVRGFYFDFEEQAPGPICATTSEVISALMNLEQVQATYAERYARFKERFCALDDGGAARRVVDRVFGS